MLFILIAAFVIGDTDGLRNCTDCVDVTKCKDLVLRVRADKSETTAKMLRKTQCGCMKFCCSDFSIEAKMTEVQNQISYKDDIENHPNVNLLPDQCGQFEGKRIIGGEMAEMNEFPWLVLIAERINEKITYDCGGSLINRYYVLTAAHCIKERDIVSVRIGEYNTSSENDCVNYGGRKKCQNNLQDIGISEKLIHPDHVERPINLNDIALLRLKKPVNLSVANAGTVCLPILRSHRTMDISGELGIVAGWGQTEKHVKSEILLRVQVPILTMKKCNSRYSWKNSKSSERIINVFCAGKEGYDSCRGDSGGPLMLRADYKNQTYKLTQFGVVSYGPVQCGIDIPSLYTDVRKFMKWILDTIKQ